MYVLYTVCPSRQINARYESYGALSDPISCPHGHGTLFDSSTNYAKQHHGFNARLLCLAPGEKLLLSRPSAQKTFAGCLVAWASGTILLRAKQGMVCG